MIVRITDDGIPQSIIREISTLRALQNLNNPNIVKFVFNFLNIQMTSKFVEFGSTIDERMVLGIVGDRCLWISCPWRVDCISVTWGGFTLKVQAFFDVLERS